MTSDAPSGPSTSRATVSYVYAVTRELDPTALVGVQGIGGAPIRLVDAAAGTGGGAGAPPLQAVVGDVDPAEFSEHAVAEHRDDLAWLGATARAHHAVVGAVGAKRPVVPFALATVYHGDDRVRVVIGERAELFATALDRVSGRSEWGVKAFARPAADATPVRAASGRDYLRARRTALRAVETAVDAASRAGEELHDALARRAVDSRRHRLQDAALSGRTETMVLNGAYLLDDDAVDEAGGPGGAGVVRDVVEAWAHDTRVTVELTGPWVPYSFTGAPPTEGGPS